MITLLLSRGNDEGAYLYLPASDAQIKEAFAELDGISEDSAAPIRIMEVQSNVYNLHSYIKSVDIEAPGVLDKLGALAQKLQTMSRDNCLKFEGVLDANSVNGIDDVLRLSESLDDYAALSDAGTSSSLGKYLVAHGVGGFPESVKPYLDYQIIGEEFYADHGGAFCRGGYVVRKDELPEQLIEPEREANSKYYIMLRLRTISASTDLLLPATEASMDEAKQRLGIEEFAEAEVVVVDFTLPYLGQYIPQDCITVENANELALAIEEMHQTDGELLKYLSVLEVEQPETFTKACQLALDLDDFERVPGDKEEYGRMVLERLGADTDIMNEIDGFMDYASFGEAWMREDGAVRTEFGLVRRLSEPFDTQNQSGLALQ